MFENLDSKLILPIVGFIAWLVRLEAKVLYLERELKEYKEAAKEREKLLWEKFDKLQENLNTVLHTTTRIEENLKHLNKDQ